MKITWNQNPLLTAISLNEHEKEVLRLKIRIDELEEHIGSASVLLDPDNATWVMGKSPRHPEGRTLQAVLAEVREDHLNMSYVYDEVPVGSDGLSARVERLLECYVGDLLGSHIGDCTCVPCSCTKCYAEGLLGVYTITGLGKHQAYQIQQAFKDQGTTIDQALEKLKSFEPRADWEGWEAHAARWRDEAAAAHRWLSKYKERLFPGHQNDPSHTVITEMIGPIRKPKI